MSCCALIQILKGFAVLPAVRVRLLEVVLTSWSQCKEAIIDGLADFKLLVLIEALDDLGKPWLRWQMKSLQREMENQQNTPEQPRAGWTTHAMSGLLPSLGMREHSKSK